jgi:hypothetical protein
MQYEMTDAQVQILNNLLVSRDRLTQQVKAAEASIQEFVGLLATKNEVPEDFTCGFRQLEDGKIVMECIEEE